MPIDIGIGLAHADDIGKKTFVKGTEECSAFLFNCLKMYVVNITENIELVAIVERLYQVDTVGKNAAEHGIPRMVNLLIARRHTIACAERIAKFG